MSGVPSGAPFFSQRMVLDDMASSRGVWRFRYWWCLCFCLVFSPLADASKRVYPRLNGPSESTGGVPSRNAGSLVTTNGLLHGQTILRDPRGPGRHMNLPAKQGSFFSIRGITINAQGMFRRNLPAIVMGGAIAGIGYGLDWIFDEADQQWKKEGDGTPIDLDPSMFHWAPSYQGATEKFALPEDACVASVAYGQSANPNETWTFESIRWNDQFTASCIGDRTLANGSVLKNLGNGGIRRAGTGCPEGSSYDTDRRACIIPGTLIPITEADISQIEPEITGANPEFIQDILRNACNGSNAPDACFESLMDKTELSGPSSVTTPSTTSTTTVTGPDGVAGTSTTTTNTTFNITYGPNYYQYTTTTNSTTTKPDGTTETTEETDAPPFGEDPREPEEEIQEAPSPCTGEDCAGPAYSDAYTPTEETKEQHIDSYLQRVQAIPLIEAIGSFFDVSVAASCPVWTVPIDLKIFNSSLNWNATFDYHCQSFFTDYQPYCAAVFMLIGGFIAFRIGML